MAGLVRVGIIIDGNRLSDNQITAFSLNQEVGRHHTFEIHLNLKNLSSVLKESYMQFLGKDVVIGLDNTDEESIPSSMPTERFKGIITNLSVSNYNGSSALSISGNSYSILLDDGENCRSFTEKSLHEIFDEVCSNYKSKMPSPPKVDPQEFKGSVPYTVQYEENNFAFLSRLADRNGEWFYSDGIDLFFGYADPGEAVKLDFLNSGLIDFNVNMNASPSKFSYTVYDYEKDEKTALLPSLDLSDSFIKKIDDKAEEIFPQLSKSALNVNYDEHESRYLGSKERISVDEQLTITGSTRNPKLKIGAKIEITDNGLGQDFGSFIIVRLSHSLSQGGDYTNHFVGCSADLVSPPLSQMFSSPVCLPQLAKVTDVSDPKKLGRVKVKFPWQNGEEKSPWIRVATPYSGSDKGFYIIPEIDDQVLVAFENNNPEKPYVQSSMYHGGAKPEYFESKNKVKGFKSKGNNEWKFDDASGKIDINAPKEINLKSKKITLTGSEEIFLKSGSSAIKLTQDGKIEISGTSEVKITTAKFIADGKAEVHLGIETSQMLTKCLTSDTQIGAIGKIQSQMITIKGNNIASLEGAIVLIEGSATTNIKGGLVNINT
jgi:uncharacterized protein involved in type VI secretion and phage assembly